MVSMINNCQAFFYPVGQNYFFFCFFGIEVVEYSLAFIIKYVDIQHLHLIRISATFYIIAFVGGGKIGLDYSCAEYECMNGLIIPRTVGLVLQKQCVDCHFNFYMV